jgi:[protein-PII] uridylyltransferase
MLAGLDPADSVVVAVRQNTEQTVVISVVGWDRRGLLADVVGALAGLGLDVLEARVFTRHDAVVLDWLVVRRRANAPAPRLSELITQVEEAGRGTVDIEHVVTRQERRWDERPGTEAQLIAPVIVIDRGSTTTRIEVGGRDAPGVLFRLLRVLADTGLDVAAARVATLGPQVRDVFFVAGDDDVDWDELATRLRAVVTADAS